MKLKHMDINWQRKKMWYIIEKKDKVCNPPQIEEKQNLEYSAVSNFGFVSQQKLSMRH